MRAAKWLRGAVSTSGTGPISATLPDSSTSTRSANVNTSSRSWVTRIAAQPLRVTTLRSTARVAAAAATSRPARGSSSSNTSGSAASALAMATR